MKRKDGITHLYWGDGGTHALPTLLSYCLFQLSTFSRICLAGTYRIREYEKKKRGRRRNCRYTHIQCKEE
jgi:hypothetical protein